MTEIVPFADLEFQDIEVDFIKDLFEGCDPEDERVASDKFQEYIESAAQRQFAQLKNDESELQEDLKKTETLASSVEQSLRELDERIQKVENSKKKYQVGDADAEKAKLVEQRNIKEGEFKELKEAAKGQHESMGKELKSIDKNALKKVSAFVQKTSDKNVVYILDHLAKFMKANINATYSQETPLFEKAEVLHDKVREVKVGGLNYKDIEKVIMHIQGKDGSSEILTKMVDDAKTYQPFFCFLKTLIKLCNWSMTAQKVEQHSKKIEVLNRKINDLEAARSRNRDILKTLEELDQLQEMKEFLQETELRIINDKKDRVNEALRLVREKLNNFVENFFKEEE